MKEMNAINLKELRKYESFESISQMDESIYNYIEYIRYDVPQSVIDVLLCLGRHSLRCVGLSFMKQSNIAKQTGYSRKTINKALNILESLGVVDSVRTKTKKGRPSVKVIRILPFSLERLQAGFTSYIGDNTNDDNELKLIEEFEPFEAESSKQENNNNTNSNVIDKISKIVDNNANLDNKLKNIVKYLSLKLGEKVKNNAIEIRNFGAYCEKVLANEIRRYKAKRQLETIQKQREEEKRHQFERFVFLTFGERFEDLGSFVQSEAIRMYNEKTKSNRRHLYYNWLEEDGRDPAVVKNVMLY